MDMSFWYTKTVSTKRAVDTVDSGGSPISTFSTNLTSISCAVQQFKSIEPVIAGRKFSQIKWVLYCGHDEDIVMKDLVTYNSVDYEIIEQQFEENDDSYMKLLLAQAQ